MSKVQVSIRLEPPFSSYDTFSPEEFYKALRDCASAVEFAVKTSGLTNISIAYRIEEDYGNSLTSRLELIGQRDPTPAEEEQQRRDAERRERAEAKEFERLKKKFEGSK